MLRKIENVLVVMFFVIMFVSIIVSFA